MSALQRQLMSKHLIPSTSSTRGGSLSSRGKQNHDFTPIVWSEYFDSMKDLKIGEHQDSFRVYLSGYEDVQQESASMSDIEPITVIIDDSLSKGFP
jgi:hypothetical protein